MPHGSGTASIGSGSRATPATRATSGRTSWPARAWHRSSRADPEPPAPYLPPVTTVPPSAAPLFGPLLTSFGQAPGPEGGHALAAVIGMAPGVAPPALQAAGQIPRPQRIDRLPGADVWRWLFTLPP